MQEKRRAFAIIARHGSAPVGFKLGYEQLREEFYSWLGGVHPEYRRRGIARDLLLKQHEWCRRTGYACVSTEALNDNAAMLALNLEHGFRIVGTRVDDRGLKILLSRRLRMKEP